MTRGGNGRFEAVKVHRPREDGNRPLSAGFRSRGPSAKGNCGATKRGTRDGCPFFSRVVLVHRLWWCLLMCWWSERMIHQDERWLRKYHAYGPTVAAHIKRRQTVSYVGKKETGDNARIQLSGSVPLGSVSSTTCIHPGDLEV